MKNKIIIFLTFFVILLAFTTNVSAHPGKTAADGCHYCRTNCDSWGVPWNERHCHGGGSTSGGGDTSGGNTSGGSTTTQTETIPTTKPIIYNAPTSTPRPTKTPTPTPLKTIDVLRKIRRENTVNRGITWASLIRSSLSGSSVLRTVKAPTSPPNATPIITQVSGLFYPVSSVVDGDTIKVRIEGKVDTVRLLAIDTPETKDPRKPVQCFGDAASAKMNELVGGKQVRLEKDHTQPDRDKYKRLLRYVYLEDGRDVGAEMIKQGYAFAYTRFPSDKLEEYRGYEKQARETNAGLWGSCQIQENGTTKSTNPS